jgi:hypothetical protein
VTSSDFGGIAYAALRDMRQRTNSVLSDPGVVQTHQSVFSRLMNGLRAVTNLALRWVHARRAPRLRVSHDWLVLFSPSRTPMDAEETDHAFLSRICRTNRPRDLPELIGIKRKSSVLCLEVGAGLDFTGTKPSVLDYILAQISFTDAIQLLLAFLQKPAAKADLVAARIIDLVQQSLNRQPSNVVLLTSNSMLAEFVRLAAMRTSAGLLTEVLHGIASTSMQAYYDFIEANALAKLQYVNLIAELVHFPSIERHMLRDDKGEIATNCHIWSRVGPDKTLCIPHALVDQQPVVIVGGTSSAKDYFQTSFFESECRLMSIARQLLPHHAIVYCPHPANNADDDGLLGQLHRHTATLSELPTFSMLFCADAVVGTYSTSLFEAALLGKRVFLLPFDHTMVMSELLQDVVLGRTPETLESDFAEFISTLGKSDQGSEIPKCVSASSERLGLALKVT